MEAGTIDRQAVLALLEELRQWSWRARLSVWVAERAAQTAQDRLGAVEMQRERIESAVGVEKTTPVWEAYSHPEDRRP